MSLHFDDPDWSGQAVVIDTETTGRDPKTARVVSLAMFRADFSKLKSDGQITDIESYEIMFHPGQQIPPKTTDIHGITDAWVKNCPKFAEAAQEIRDWIGDLPVIAHNVSYDKGVLNAEFKRAGVKTLHRNKSFCTMCHFQYDWNEGLRRGSRLDDVAERFGIKGRTGEMHGAKEDAWICLHLAMIFYQLANGLVKRKQFAHAELPPRREREREARERKEAREFESEGSGCFIVAFGVSLFILIWIFS